MFKRAIGPVLVGAALLVSLAATARSRRMTAAGEGSAKSAPLTYDEAHARLRLCPRWHVIDSCPANPPFWVTREQRQAKELRSVLVCVDWPQRPWADRRGVVCVRPIQSLHKTRTLAVDEDDTSYWRVVGEVHLAGDPAFVREIAAYLREAPSP